MVFLFVVVFGWSVNMCASACVFLLRFNIESVIYLIPNSFTTVSNIII